jgi:hypothetical protein
MSETINWSVSGGGTISEGKFLSSGTAGTYTITVAAQSNTSIKGSAVAVILDEYPAPTVQNSQLTTSEDTPVQLSLPFSSISPGPFEFTITQQPGNGTLKAAGNDVEYTPNNGFTGTDTYKWKVKDLSNSKESAIATVTIEVQAAGIRNYVNRPHTDNIIIFPNPITNEIALDNCAQLKEFCLKIYNLDGILVKQGVNTARLPCQGISPGVYLIRVVTRQGVYSRRVVVAN